MAPLRMLVVEDEALIRWAVVETLTAAGHHVLQAANAAAAVEAVSASQPIDVVLLDFRLPDSNDLSLLTTIRRTSPASAVVMMTAYGTPETTAEAKRLGVYDVLAKPFDIGCLEGVLLQAYEARPH